MNQVALWWPENGVAHGAIETEMDHMALVQ
jgi:hypothetical protein